jgi:hypothetical protein
LTAKNLAHNIAYPRSADESRNFRSDALPGARKRWSIQSARRKL